MTNIINALAAALKTEFLLKTVWKFELRKYIIYLKKALLIYNDNASDFET